MECASGNGRGLGSVARGVWCFPGPRGHAWVRLCRHIAHSLPVSCCGWAGGRGDVWCPWWARSVVVVVVVVLRPGRLIAWPCDHRTAHGSWPQVLVALAGLRAGMVWLGGCSWVVGVGMVAWGVVVGVMAGACAFCGTVGSHWGSGRVGCACTLSPTGWTAVHVRCACCSSPWL